MYLIIQFYKKLLHVISDCWIQLHYRFVDKWKSWCIPWLSSRCGYSLRRHYVLIKHLVLAMSDCVIVPSHIKLPVRRYCVSPHRACPKRLRYDIPRSHSSTLLSANIIFLVFGFLHRFWSYIFILVVRGLSPSRIEA